MRPSRKSPIVYVVPPASENLLAGVRTPLGSEVDWFSCPFGERRINREEGVAELQGSRLLLLEREERGDKERQLEKGQGRREQDNKRGAVNRNRRWGGLPAVRV